MVNFGKLDERVDVRDQLDEEDAPVVVWESVAAFKAAFAHPEFQRQIDSYPPSAVSPTAPIRKLAVPGICVAG